MKLFNEIKPYTGVALITAKEQSFGIEWWHWLILTFITLIITCTLCILCCCCCVRLNIYQLLKRSYLPVRRPIYKSEIVMKKQIKEETNINKIDPNSIHLNKIDPDNIDLNKIDPKIIKIENEIKKDKPNAKSDSTSSESLDSLGTHNTAFNYYDENISIYLPTTEIKS